MPSRVHKRGIVGYSKKTALLEEAITHMNTGKYGRSSAALKELLALDPQNTEARRLFATLHLKLGSLVTARQAFESLANEAIGRQDYWLAESLLKEYLAAGPRCVPFLEQLGQVYQEKGDDMAAVVELGKAIEILRDDPDPDNPEKAAQLYSKIRELAPASSVALQLASLFDVQTGEFLVRPSTPSTTPSEDSALSNDAVMPQDDGPSQATEHPLPDVMPWEMTEEAASAPEIEPELLDVPTSAAVEEVPRPIQESIPEEAPFSFQASEPSPAESSSDGWVQGVATSETPSETPSAVSAPMPWEQMADASVRIPEPETPFKHEEVSVLESVLVSLRTENEAVASPPAMEDAPPTEPVISADLAETAPLETAQTDSASLPAPMPWEQISDPAIQIPIAETPSSPLQIECGSNPAVAAPELADPPAVSGTVTTLQPVDETPAQPLEEAHSEEPPAFSPGEVPPITSFSWNSVFDKAWKFTAGTMAPSPTVPLETEQPAFDEPQAIETPALESVIVETPMVSSSVAPENLIAPLAPETPLSFSDSASEQVIEEVAAAAPVDAPPAPAETSSPPELPAHWNTGEVAVQVHRPSKKKKRWDREFDEAAPASDAPPAAESPSEPEPEARREWKSTIDESAPPAEPVFSPPVDSRPDWMQATDAITFARTEPATSQPKWNDVAAVVAPAAETASPAAASAVDVLFSPSPTVEEVHSRAALSWSKPRPRLVARLHRVRIGIASFVGSCFSTTRSLTFLALMITIATVVVAAAGVGTVGVMWMVMEDPPSSLYQTLTIAPPRVIADVKKNGYLLLLGFDAPEGQDPVQAGFERRADPQRDQAAAQVCMGDEIKTAVGAGGASNHVVKGWMRSGDLLSNIRGQGVTIKSLTSRESTAMARYQQWVTMPFDDWGFGQLLSPNCAHVLLAHRLFVLEGFNQDLPTGLDRLEADVQAWRAALAQSKTLPMKMLAVTAIQDNASVASGLLSRADLDGTALARLSKMVRPLDQVELSVRWPMQSQFVSATKAVTSELRDDKAAERPWHVSIAAAMRLPVQRRANAYAEYYEAANKTVASGRYTNLPKLSSFVHTPPSGVIDYLTNPLEHIIGLEPLPSWDPYVMRMVETDAQLRLAGLQAWLRRGPQETDVLMRLAKAGQAYYDPFTGLPMLVNQRTGVIYSVGRDGKDQEGDDVRDVTALIPLSASEPRRAVPASFR